MSAFGITFGKEMETLNSVYNGGLWACLQSIN